MANKQRPEVEICSKYAAKYAADTRKLVALFKELHFYWSSETKSINYPSEIDLYLARAWSYVTASRTSQPVFAYSNAAFQPAILA